MKHLMKNQRLLTLALGAVVAAASVWAAEPKDVNELMQASDQAMATFKKEDPSLEEALTNAAGYAIFPKLGKGGFIVGGGGGVGVLYVNGEPVGKVTSQHMSIGLQAGGQSHSELILLENPQALEKFKQGKSKLTAQASAVAASAGASARGVWQDGMKVLVTGEQGLMHDLSVGGQTFTFQPFTHHAPGT
jgi:lipid-binding SYLF domain-containing protein